MHIIAIVTEARSIRRIAHHFCESGAPPHMVPARGPPLWEMADAAPTECDPRDQPAPDFKSA